MSKDNLYDIRTGTSLTNDDQSTLYPVYIQHGSGGGGGGGSDDGALKIWRDSVEKRLESLDRRHSTIEKEVGEIKVSIGKIETEIKHLPGKGFIATAVTTALVIFGAISLFSENLSQKFDAKDYRNASTEVRP